MAFPKGHILLNLKLSESELALVRGRDWQSLDQVAKHWLNPGGKLWSLLAEHARFTSVEHILALRSGPDDDEGIWHDDGSRLLAFSLSLTLKHESVHGGEISIRPKGSSEAYVLTCQPLGTLVIFNTGQDNFEHRVSAVKAGERLVLAGWCT
ncbi:MAG: hypothetical protein CME71_06425 [Halobacteriovorax sp.]|nr:hypothetical protein [Halobacteriovorax sp.]|tara:strand:+ start:606 stop:1061 length:456 start_codon:yes stop_codon:yes gene_type:complete